MEDPASPIRLRLSTFVKTTAGQAGGQGRLRRGKLVLPEAGRRRCMYDIMDRKRFEASVVVTVKRGGTS